MWAIAWPDSAVYASFRQDISHCVAGFSHLCSTWNVSLHLTWFSCLCFMKPDFGCRCHSHSCALITPASWHAYLVESVQAYKSDARGALFLFCAVFGVCCNTIVLVLFELLDLMTFNSRLTALRLHVVLLVCCMLFAIPWCVLFDE